jgi:hydrogenase/urease accessory protein HupE
MSKICCAIGGAILVALASAAQAHDPGLSSAGLTINSQSIEAVVTFNRRDLDGLGSANDALARGLLQITADGNALTPTAIGFEIDVNGNAIFHLHYHAPVLAGTLRIASGVIDDLPFGHRQIVTVQSAKGGVLLERLIGARDNEVIVQLANMPLQNAPRSNFVDFLLLGVRHILTGYDHLLFLAALLVACSTLTAAARLITCFTIAHSISLALATFNIVSLTPRIVEPAIAASIVYVGLENILARRPLHWREALTFGFGLIHGLGFATALREMGVGEGTGGVAVPLFSFNLGVETGQLAIAAIMLPLTLRLKRTDNLPRLAVPALSCLIACAGAFWFVERVLS